MAEKTKEKDSKPIIFQKRDQDLLLDLYDLQFLDVEYLENNIYKGCSKSFIYRRMNRLINEGYIQTFRTPIMNPNPNGQSKNVYSLDKRGANEVKAMLGEVNWRYDVTQRTPNHVHHQLLLSHVRASFEEDRQVEEEERIPKNENFEMVQYLNEKNGYYKHEANTTSFVIRPDGTLVIKSKKTGNYVPFFLELERSYQAKQTTIGKLERYNTYCEEKLYEGAHRSFDYPVGRPRVIFIARDIKGVERLLEHSAGVNTKATAGVLYTTFDQITTDPYGKIFFAKDSTDPEQLYSLTSKID